MEEKPQKNNKIWKLLLVLCLVGAGAALAVIGWNFHVRNQAERRFEELSRQTASGEEPEAESIQEEDEKEPETKLSREEKLRLLEQELGIEIPQKDIDFAALKEETNPDIYAWIYIPDTKIDYPVLQHAEDNTYYLNYNLDGTRGYPGCIYTENYNSKAFDDHNTVLYGHNMKDGSMFAGLHNYEDSQYFEEHPYLFIYTEEDTLVYRVFAAYEFSDVHLLKGYDTETEEGFSRYLKEAMEYRTMNRNVSEEVSVTGESRILTLSTCIASKPENRYLVQGVLLNED